MLVGIQVTTQTCETGIIEVYNEHTVESKYSIDITWTNLQSITHSQGNNPTIPGPMRKHALTGREGRWCQDIHDQTATGVKRNLELRGKKQAKVWISGASRRLGHSDLGR